MHLVFDYHHKSGLNIIHYTFILFRALLLKPIINLSVEHCDILGNWPEDLTLLAMLRNMECTNI